MNKSLTILIALILYSTSNIAQELLPNANLETWVTEGEYEIPEGWETSNEATYQSPPFNYLTVEKTDDAYYGEWAARISSIDILGNVAPGFITTARFDFSVFPLSSEINGGIYFNQRPESISGWYKYAPSVPEDKCIVGAFLFRYPEGEPIDTVGYVQFESSEVKDEYTYFVSEFIYYNEETPDSLSLTILCTDFDNPIAGSVMYIDNLNIEMPLGNQIPLMTDISNVYPNPNNGVFSIHLEEKSFIQVFTINGQLVYFKQHNAGINQINLEGLSKGQYVIKAQNNNKPINEIIYVQ
jgi:hypothetical protein